MISSTTLTEMNDFVNFPATKKVVIYHTLSRRYIHTYPEVEHL